MSATLKQHVEAMVMMIAADGEYQESEHQSVVDQLATHPAAQGLSEDEIDDLLAECAETIMNDGVDVRLRKLAEAATDPGERTAILRSAILTCVADGDVAPEEMEMLRKMMNAFTMTEKDLQSQIDALIEKRL